MCPDFCLCFQFIWVSIRSTMLDHMVRMYFVTQESAKLFSQSCYSILNYFNSKWNFCSTILLGVGFVHVINFSPFRSCIVRSQCFNFWFHLYNFLLFILLHALFIYGDITWCFHTHLHCEMINSRWWAKSLLHLFPTYCGVNI